MTAESHLLHTLSTHNIPLGTDDVSWAFQAAKTSEPVTAWVETYLRPSTVLSLEESSLLTHLNKTGAAKKPLPLALEPPETETELLSRIAELNASTALLREQSEQLRQQATTLSAQRSRRRAERERRRKLDAARKRKWAGELEELVAVRDELVVELREEVRDLLDTVADPVADTEEVEKALQSDDRVLARLERLAAELVVGEEEEEPGRGIEPLVARLAALETKAVRKRLERVYLTYACPGTSSGDTEEIDGLYAEIPAVARGSVYNEFLAPLMAAANRAAKSRGENWRLGGEYIVDVLTHLRNRLLAMKSLLTSCHDRDGAVLTLVATIDREAEASIPSRPTTPPQQGQKRLGSPVRFADAPANKLGRSIPFLTPMRRRGNKPDFSKKDYPELALLSHLGILLPPSSPGVPPVVTEQFLAQQIQAAAGRVEAVAEMALESWEQARSEGAAMTRVLREALWYGNEFEVPHRGEGLMVVVRKEVRDGGVQVEQGVKEVAAAMGRIVGRVEEVEREGGDAGGEGRKAEFVARWGR
jgi:hypothetical protein